MKITSMETIDTYLYRYSEYKEKQINNFDTKTKVSGMGGRGGPIDSVRGKNVEPREENDPNPNQK